MTLRDRADILMNGPADGSAACRRPCAQSSVRLKEPRMPTSARSRRRQWILGGAASLAAAGTLFGADGEAPQPRIEIRRGTQTSSSTTDVNPDTGVSTPVDRSAERELLAQAGPAAADLVTLSRDSFNRGLMPLRDYLEQTALVLQIDLMSSDAQNSTPATAWKSQVERLSDAARRLNRFNQPAAEGWASDVALAEWALADAEYHLAEAEKNTPVQEQAARRRADWAAEHVRRREWDVSIGAAPESSLARAMGLFAAAEHASPEQGADEVRLRIHADYITQLSTIKVLTQEWAAQGAGIGRADRVLQTAAEVDLEHVASRDAEGKLVLNPQSLQAADATLHELFDVQLDFYGHGTADLYDLSRTWTVWRNLHVLASPKPDLLSDPQRSSRTTALRTLHDLAAQTEDLRGRNAADVKYVDLLTQLDAVDLLQTEHRRNAGYLD
jgi:hypothetical protein